MPCLCLSAMRRATWCDTSAGPSCRLSLSLAMSWKDLFIDIHLPCPLLLRLNCFDLQLRILLSVAYDHPHPTSLLASDRMNVILSIDRQTHCHGSRLSNRRDWFPFAGRRGPSSALSSKKERQDKRQKTKDKDKDKTRCRDLKMKQGCVTGLVDLSQSDLQIFKSHPRPKNALIGLVPEWNTPSAMASGEQKQWQKRFLPPEVRGTR